MDGVGDEISGAPDHVDELRGERGGRDPQRLLLVVHDHEEHVPRGEAVHRREPVPDDDLLRAVPGEPVARGEVHVVDHFLAPVRQREDPALAGLDHLLDVDQHLEDDPGPDAAEPRDLLQASGEDPRRLLHGGVEVGHAVLGVVRVARAQEAPVRREHRDPARDPAGDDEGDGDGLPLHREQVAEELLLERPHHSISSGLSGFSFTTTSSTRPERIRITRSPMPPMAALWVIRRRVVPSARFTSRSTSRTILPVS